MDIETGLIRLTERSQPKTKIYFDCWY